MAISPIYPVNLQNGTVADAGQVMANFNQIQTDVNTNAAHNGANSDITSLSGLTTPIPISEGGTGASTAPQALINLGVIAAIAAIITPPVGSFILWGAASPPPSFFECNGQAISRTTYSTLFGVLGITFGAGDGATTFNIPDLRGQFVRGWADTGSVDSGRTFGSNQAGDVIPHNHTIVDPSHQHGVGEVVGVGNGGGVIIAGYEPTVLAQETGLSSTGITINDSTGVETRPVNVALMYCVRYQ